MMAILALCVVGGVLVAACIFAAKLTASEDSSKTAATQEANTGEKSEEEKELEHFFFPNYPYMYGGGVWGDPFSPFNTL